MVVTLILMVCLSASPDVCKDERPPIAVAGAVDCSIRGEILAQEWLEEHPKWMLKGWKCLIGMPEKPT